MSTTRPTRRVAVVGAGPSGLFAAQALLKSGVDVRIDILDRLPSPFGLLRYGVAPDHTSIKAVADKLAAVFADERVRFFGMVELGTDVTRRQLLDAYDAVVYAAGASEDRRLGIPGEDLQGCVAAREFVAWYSGHPDAHAQQLGLVRTAVCLGVGNVAVDVARVLLVAHGQLASTDMPQLVLDELAASSVTDVWIVGRRGPQHASFTTPELRELLTLDGVAVDVDPLVLEGIDAGDLDRRTTGNLEALRDAAGRMIPEPRAVLHLLFWHRPVEILGDQRVDGVVLERTQRAGGSAVAGTDERFVIGAQLVCKAIGYRGKPLPGVPFDDVAGVIPNAEGRVTDADGRLLPGEYVVGWIKRGPIGVIGTNKSDATQTVARLLEDLSDAPPRDFVDIEAVLAERGRHASTFADWLRIDAAERELGGAQERARTKIESWHALRDVIRAGREGGPLEREGGALEREAPTPDSARRPA